MTDFVKLAGAFAKKYPRPSLHTRGDPESWTQMCGNLMYRFCREIFTNWTPRLTGPNAWNVGLDSGPLNKDAGKAPAGAVHWWRNRNKTGFPGHTSFDLTGGGKHTFMATDALEQHWGVAIGISSVWAYNDAKPFMEYMGWSTHYAGAPTVVGSQAGSTPAAGSSNTLKENTVAFDAEEQHFLNGGFRTVIDEVVAEINGIPKEVWGYSLAVTIPATKTAPARTVEGKAEKWFLNMSNAVGQSSGQIAGLTEALKLIGSGKEIDDDALASITNAAKAGAITGAQEGAGRAFDNLTVTLSTGK